VGRRAGKTRPSRDITKFNHAFHPASGGLLSIAAAVLFQTPTIEYYIEGKGLQCCRPVNGSCAYNDPY
jgi:hypothetical protein